MTTAYNGIEDRPFCEAYPSEGDEVMPVPYLDAPPEVIPIDTGRQLLVDDFLIAESTLSRTFHKPVAYANNPVMKPETAIEIGKHGAAAVPKSGGVWYDTAAGQYRMWYDAGWSHRYAHALSADGIVWQRQPVGKEGNNGILPRFAANSSTAWIDPHDPDPLRRYKMFVRQPDCNEPDTGQSFRETGGRKRGYVMSSADGIHWSDPVVTSPVGDRSTVFYNPFRRKWVFSIRSYRFGETFARTRHYRECTDLMGEAVWDVEEELFWTRADQLDEPDPHIGEMPQLYNLDAVAYESLMLGIFEIHLGPPNNICAQGGCPKTIDLKLGFSRDAFHWHRPDRSAFITSSRREGAWDRGYVQSVGGCCLVFQDELRFYYTGFRGDPTRTGEKEETDNGMYANASTGMATLRRDGFASLDADASGGAVVTRQVTFSGKHLFVNLDAPDGELRCEVLTPQGEVVEGYAIDACVPLSADTCCRQIVWQGARHLGELAGRPVRFRFELTRGRLYAFWVSRSERGDSGGWLGAGSADYGDLLHGGNDAV